MLITAQRSLRDTLARGSFAAVLVFHASVREYVAEQLDKRLST